MCLVNPADTLPHCP
jgi:tripartite motif-containing protein 71